MWSGRIACTAHIADDIALVDTLAVRHIITCLLYTSDAADELDV